MKNFIQKNAIFLAALLAVIIIIAILLATGRPRVKYVIKTTGVAALLSDTSGMISPVQFFGLISGEDKGLVPVDLRNAGEFNQGHIPNAVNIPVPGLLEKESLSFFTELKESGQVAVLYGEDQLQANGPWMLLQQLGFSNVKILKGGYDFYSRLPLADSVLKSAEPLWNAELLLLDTAAFRKTAVSAAEAENPVQPKKEKVVPVKKAESTGGGC